MSETVLGSSLGPEEGQEVPMRAPQQEQLHRDLLSLDRSGGEAAVGKRHILVPVDDTEDSEHAIRWALAMLADDSVFHLLHVVPEPQMVHVWASTYIPPDEDAELVEVEDTKLFVTHRFAKMLMQARVPFQLHVIVGPTDTDSICRVINKKARDVGADCIVLARHSKGRLKEMWVGSVTKACVHTAPVPVAVVPHDF